MQADGSNLNDGNNSVNIMNIDIYVDVDVSYNNRFKVENAKITGIKAVNSSGCTIDVIVNHASINNTATSSNTNTNNGNANGNINININEKVPRYARHVSAPFSCTEMI